MPSCQRPASLRNALRAVRVGALASGSGRENVAEHWGESTCAMGGPAADSGDQVCGDGSALTGPWRSESGLAVGSCHHTRSNTVAIPWPRPMHMVATPVWRSPARIWCSRVVVMRAPEQPRG